MSARPTSASRIGSANLGSRRLRTDGSLATEARRDPESALALASAALAAPPAGLLTDLDGTLAPIVPIPSEARPVAGAVEALRALAARLSVVGVITGRAALEARRILGDERGDLLVVGNHGLEWLEPGMPTPRSDPRLQPVREALASVLGRIHVMEDGIWVEPKGLSATVHYRHAANPASARERILASLGDVSGLGLETREGRMSIELRPVGSGNKGSAVRLIAERHGLRGLLVAGDDTTDLDMFAAARELELRGVRTASIGVAGGGEVPPEVASAVDALLPDPHAFARLLRRLAGDGGR